MTYQYISKAIYRLPKFRDVIAIELHKEDGSPLPPLGEEEAFYLFGCRKVAGYWIENRIMHCRLEGVR